MIEMVVFGIATAGLLVGGLAVVTARSPLRAAVYLIGCMLSMALLFVLLSAPFVAAMQVLVYAGAVMVLFVFVIMLLNLGNDLPAKPAYLSVAKLAGTVAVVYIGGRMAQAALAVPGRVAGEAPVGTVKAIGVLLLTDYLFAFEALSVLLLVAVVGGVVLGLKRLT